MAQNSGAKPPLRPQLTPEARIRAGLSLFFIYLLLLLAVAAALPLMLIFAGNPGRELCVYSSARAL